MDRHLARNEAREAERLSASAPQQARRLASRALEDATAFNDALGIVLAERAMGLAARELNDFVAARRHLRRSINLARRHGFDDELAASATRLATVLSLSGDPASALEGIESVTRSATGATRARLRVQRANVLQRTGRTEEALEEYRLAIPALRRSGLATDEAQALTNRAILRTYRGDYDAAVADLERALVLAPKIGAAFPTAKVHHNLGFVAASRGNVPEALALYDRAQAEFAELGQSQAPVLLDRCEALLSVGLAGEGLESASAAVTELEGTSSGLDLAEARLMAARAALEAGDAKAAQRYPRRARGELRRQARAGWVSFADYVIARASLTQRRSPSGIAVSEIAAALFDAGWVVPSLELRLAFAQAALDHGRRDEALDQLRTITRARGGPAIVRSHRWHAIALTRLAAGDEKGCQRALRAGLRSLEEHHTSLGATELRVHAAGQAEALARLGFRLALGEHDPTSVLAWAERWRAGALRTNPARPSAQPEVEEFLGELRRTSAAIEAAALAGHSTEALLRRQVGLERAVRDFTRRTPGTRDTPLSPASATELRRALGERALIEYVALDGRLYAVTVTKRRTRLFSLGSLREVSQEADSLRFSYVRLASGRGSSDAIATFAAAAEHAAARLDELLFGPLDEELGERSLVIVPTGRLHHLPWAGLSHCAERLVSVAPSATLWAETASQREQRRGRVVLVAGPGLPHAEAEIERLSGIYPRATVLTGSEATTQRVAKALNGARVAHIAAHGNFRSDNPLFSSLQLHDGRLTVYDLELLEKAPKLLVLSACESGLNAVRPGDELLGLSAAVLSLGTTNLMASVVPVPDVETAQFMVEVHRYLRRGEDPPDALAHARQSFAPRSHAALVTTAGFVCFGL